MKQNLKTSIIQIIDLYEQRSKSFYSFSLIFSIFSTIITGIIAVIIGLLASNILNIDGISKNSTFWEIIREPFILKHIGELSSYLIIISLGLYAVYLKKNLNNIGFHPTFKNFLKTITSKNWKNFILIIGLFCLIYLLTFKELFDTEKENTGILGLLNQFIDPNYVSRKILFYKWINSIIELVKNYLPYFGAMYILISDQYEKLDKNILKQYKSIFLVMIILSFCVNTILTNVMEYLNFYVINLINIPFHEPILVSILKFNFFIIATAYFYLALIGTFLFPIMNITSQNLNENYIIDITKKDDLTVTE
jgi:hypothetical protein